jgi:hypothetical protein
MNNRITDDMKVDAFADEIGMRITRDIKKDLGHQPQVNLNLPYVGNQIDLTQLKSNPIFKYLLPYFNKSPSNIPPSICKLLVGAIISLKTINNEIVIQYRDNDKLDPKKIPLLNNQPQQLIKSKITDILQSSMKKIRNIIKSGIPSNEGIYRLVQQNILYYAKYPSVAVEVIIRILGVWKQIGHEYTSQLGCLSSQEFRSLVKNYNANDLMIYFTQLRILDLKGPYNVKPANRIAQQPPGSDGIVQAEEAITIPTGQFDNNNQPINNYYEVDFINIPENSDIPGSLSLNSIKSLNKSQMLNLLEMILGIGGKYPGKSSSVLKAFSDRAILGPNEFKGFKCTQSNY